MNASNWLAAGLLLALAASRPAAGEVVVLSLRASAVVPGPIVLVRDVVVLQGGTQDQAQQMAELDLTELPGAGPGLVLSRKQVAWRLHLAGHDPKSFRIEGAESITVRRACPQLTETDLVTTARQHLMQQVTWPAEEVLVRLAHPIVLPAVPLQPSDDVRLEPRGPFTNRLLGNVRIEVGVDVNGHRQADVPVHLEVRRFQAVAVVTQRIAHGEVLTASKVLKDWRATGATEGHLPYPEALAGRKARKDLMPGRVVAPEDVETAAPDAPLLVKSRQQVKLIARVGVMRVTAVGEAMQDGHSGDIVRVRNVDSKKVLQGRVIGEAAVEVEY